MQSGSAARAVSCRMLDARALSCALADTAAGSGSADTGGGGARRRLQLRLRLRLRLRRRFLELLLSLAEGEAPRLPPCRRACGLADDRLRVGAGWRVALRPSRLGPGPASTSARISPSSREVVALMAVNPKSSAPPSH